LINVLSLDTPHRDRPFLINAEIDLNTEVEFHSFFAMSLDGFIAGKHHDLSWLKPFEGSGEDHGFLDFYNSCDALLMGRTTFDVVKSFPDWPYKGKPVFVATHRELSGHNDVKNVSGDFANIATSADLSKYKRIYVDGGNLIRQAIEANLLNSMTISMIPSILGQGTRGLDPINRDLKMELKSIRTFQTGIVQLVYRFTQN